MSESSGGFGSGILKGLKNLLFVSDQPAQQIPSTAPAVTPTPQQAPIKTGPAVETVAENSQFTPIGAVSDKDMKLKVYQLLESMNKPGCDFFEVWNASIEMGGANTTNVKAAFTSLKYADSSLTKAKLTETGEYYKKNLTSVLDQETTKRTDEKQRLEKEKEQLKASLVADIGSLEEQIRSLQEKLATKKEERDTIDGKYKPRLADIDNRIYNGQQSVNSVIAEMQQVLDIIQKDLT
ncbi:MAG: hypothetical protein V4722_22415 [Bacteroidota bacterium]